MNLSFHSKPDWVGCLSLVFLHANALCGHSTAVSYYGTELPSRARIEHLAVIRGRANFGAGGVEEVQFQAHAKALVVRVVFQDSGDINQTAALRALGLIQCNLGDFQITEDFGDFGRRRWGQRDCWGSRNRWRRSSRPSGLHTGGSFRSGSGGGLRSERRLLGNFFGGR